ncbi:MAG: nitrous oxide-stimulated promoter family protein [Wenzhouxiangellaceae bacterium]|nr:nitrous oxide-stimulated promoter family protein [Wenzhouxiangellaceae bacterium]
MQPTTPRLKREFRTMQRMVEIWCADQHAQDSICSDCQDFLEYAGARLAKCPYGEDKPTCAKCPVHCYKKAQREQAREIMRYAGPRMARRHPWLALMHIADKLRPVRHPMELRGSKRSFSNRPRA